MCSCRAAGRMATAQWRADAHGRARRRRYIAPQGRAAGGRRARRRAGAKAQAALDTSNQLHVYKYRYKTRFFCVGGEPRRHTHTTLSAVEFTVFVLARCSVDGVPRASADDDSTTPCRPLQYM